MLHASLTHRGRPAFGRWRRRIELGCTDDEIADAIGTEWGHRCSSPGTSSSPGYYARGGPDAAFWLGGYTPNSRADLKGPELVAAVRRVMGVGLPPEKPDKPKRARKPKGAAVPKGAIER